MIIIAIIVLLCIGVVIYAVVNAPLVEATEEEKAQIREVLRSQDDLLP